MAEMRAFVSKKTSQGSLCCVSGCGNRWGNSDGKDGNVKRKFHGFPADVTLKEQWVQAIPRSKQNLSDWVPTGHHKVCSAHFVDGMCNIIFQFIGI